MARKNNRIKWFGRRPSSKFLGSDDDGDDPDMDPGSWMSMLFVVVLLIVGVVLMIALANN